MNHHCVNVADLRVDALVYGVSARSAWYIWISGSSRRRYGLQHGQILGQVDALRNELLNGRAFASPSPPASLQSFSEHWGPALIPKDLMADPPDVLVVVPNAFLHDLPFHLVLNAEGLPLGSQMGICYASSMSLFAQCTRRNPARHLDPRSWPIPYLDRGFLPAESVGGAEPYLVAGGGTDVLGGNPEFATLLSDLVASLGIKVLNGTRTIATTPLDRPRLKALITDPNRKQFLDLLCITAHGHIDGISNRYSGLMVSEANETPIPGLRREPSSLSFFIGDHLYLIDDLPLRPVSLITGREGSVLTSAELELAGDIEASLVALLACYAGAGELVQGDEPVSLAETFLRMGAASVLAPMWPAHRTAAKIWLREFLKAWLMFGLPKALASRYATAYMNSDSDFRSLEWGSIALRGDWL